MQPHRHLSLFLSILCAFGTHSAQAAETDLCRSVCAQDKGQCRSGLIKPDAGDVVATVAAMGLLFSQSATGTPPMNTAHDMSTAIAGKKQATDEVKQLQREREDRCNSTYVQCLLGCSADAANQPDPLPKK